MRLDEHMHRVRRRHRQLLTEVPASVVSAPEPELQKTVGPGTHLTRLLMEMGFSYSAGCGCASRTTQMNRWNVSGCREHRDEILSWLREESKSQGWASSAMAAAKALAIVPAEHWTSPVEWLVDEAIRRAEQDVAIDAAPEGS